VLREIDGRTPDGARWFRGPELDLFVWSDAAGEIIRLQLSAGAGGSERAVLWHRGGAIEFATIDEGTAPGGHPRAPLLVSTRAADTRPLLHAFDRASLSIDPRVRACVLDLLRSTLDVHATTGGARP
jgi:hypothetical protein